MSYLNSSEENANFVASHLAFEVDPYVLMGIGIPGSGKTTVLNLVAKRFSLTRISPDDIRFDLTGNTVSQLRNKEIWETTYRKVGEQILKGSSVLVDAMHTSADRRRESTAIYREKGAVAIIGVLFSTPVDVCLQRNIDREKVAPTSFVNDQSHLLEQSQLLGQDPPSKFEGFDHIIRVS